MFPKVKSFYVYMFIHTMEWFKHEEKESFFKVNSANNDGRQHESNNNSVFSW